MKIIVSLPILLFLCVVKMSAQVAQTDIVKKQYTTQFSGGASIELDGIPDEALWYLEFVHFRHAAAVSLAAGGFADSCGGGDDSLDNQEA